MVKWQKTREWRWVTRRAVIQPLLRPRRIVTPATPRRPHRPSLSALPSLASQRRFSRSKAQRGMLQMVATSITVQSIRVSIISQTHKSLDECTAIAVVRRVRRKGEAYTPRLERFPFINQYDRCIPSLLDSILLSVGDLSMFNKSDRPTHRVDAERRRESWHPPHFCQTTPTTETPVDPQSIPRPPYRTSPYGIFSTHAGGRSCPSSQTDRQSQPLSPPSPSQTKTPRGNP
mgnify:CR=1 FL=1